MEPSEGVKARSVESAIRPLGDFADEEIYRSALRLCGLVLDFEHHFPDDERPLVYDELKRCTLETGARIAESFGRREAEARHLLLEVARSRLMEARHYVLVANLRYLLDSNQVESFDAMYMDLLSGLQGLLPLQEYRADGSSEREDGAEGGGDP